MWNENVCRLCLSEKNLFCVLEKRENQTDNLEQIILITTGVEILKNDVVSRKICENCHKVTVKMLEFRERSLKTDKHLKEEYAEYLKKLEGKNPPQTDKIVGLTENSVATTSLQNKDTSKPNKTQSSAKLNLHQKIKSMNPTVTNIFTLNPTIKLPSNVLSYNIDPSVWMELDSVENYFIRNKLDMRKAVQAALKSSKVSKKPSISKKQKESLPNKVVNPISIKSSDVDIKSEGTKKRKISEEDETTESDNPSKIKKRKLSSSDFSCESKTPSPTLLDTLQLKPKDNLCHVCHSVQNCPDTLRRHLKEHFRCNFCKQKFKLTLRKEEHEKTCVVKHMLTSEVYVRLERVNQETIEKYTAAPGKTEVTTNLSCTEIIELSDDDDNQKTNTSEQKSNAQPKLSTKNTVHYFSTALVRPDIKIKDDNLFNSVDMATSDFDVLKQLLKMKMTSDLKISIQEQTQTESPCNENIVKLPDTDTAKLKGLKPQLFAFKVPVRIQKGAFDVRYVTEKTSSAQKHMNLWSDIEPIGLKPIGLKQIIPAGLRPIKPMTTNNTQQLPIQLPGPIVQNPVNNQINSGTNITKPNSVPKIITKPSQKPVQIILNQFINPSISNSFTGTTATGTNNNNVRASTPTISTGVMQQQTFYSPPLMVNNTPHSYLGTNNIPRTSTPIINMGQQQVFVPNNNTSVIVGTNHVSTSTSIPMNNNGTNIYSKDHNVPNEVSLHYTPIHNKLLVQSLNSSAVPMNVNSQHRQSPNSTLQLQNFISLQRQSPNCTVVNSNSIGQRMLSPNSTVVTSNTIGRQILSPNSTAATSNTISQQRQSPNSTAATSKTISQQRLSPNGIPVPLNFNGHPRLQNYINQPSQSSKSTTATPNFNIQSKPTSNDTVLPSNTIGQQILSPNNFGMSTGSVVGNISLNTNCNVGTNSLSNSQYSAAVQNDVTSIRPMIRVKNICELK